MYTVYTMYVSIKNWDLAKNVAQHDSSTEDTQQSLCNFFENEAKQPCVMYGCPRMGSDITRYTSNCLS